MEFFTHVLNGENLYARVGGFFQLKRDFIEGGVLRWFFVLRHVLWLKWTRQLDGSSTTMDFGHSTRVCKFGIGSCESGSMVKNDNLSWKNGRKWDGDHIYLFICIRYWVNFPLVRVCRLFTKLELLVAYWLYQQVVCIS